MPRGRAEGAFTLVELLVVVAIITILAAIAVPNFINAQTRAKVTRAKADMRSLAIAIEGYSTDYDVYPPSCEAHPLAITEDGTLVHLPLWRIGSNLTTPVAYITSLIQDVFAKNSNLLERGFLCHCNEYADVPEEPRRRFLYAAIDGMAVLGMPTTVEEHIFGAYYLASVGPDQTLDHLLCSADSCSADPRCPPPFWVAYDPTNGLTSWGNIFRTELMGDDFDQRFVNDFEGGCAGGLDEWPPSVPRW
jgi:prepilin-type N-terminal cleavage/methylation domain-containing protein